MGSAASIPSQIDKDTFEQIAGDKYSPDTFDFYCDSNGMISKDKLLNLSQMTDIFLSHNWGKDAEGRDNHERVKQINAMLQARGLVTWFDEEQMAGDINDKMCNGIDNTSVVLVFITKSYISKVGGKNGKDNCKLEFGYSFRRKGPEKLIPIVMESACQSTNEWNGPIGMQLGGHLYVNCSTDDKLEGSIEDLEGRIRKLVGKTIQEGGATIEEEAAAPAVAKGAGTAAVSAARVEGNADHRKWVTWFEKNTGIMASRHADYASKLLQKGVAAENRLKKKIEKDGNFLATIGIDADDAEEMMEKLGFGAQQSEPTEEEQPEGGGGARECVCNKALEKIPDGYLVDGWSCDWPAHQGGNYFYANDGAYGCEDFLTCNWLMCEACNDRIVANGMEGEAELMEALDTEPKCGNCARSIFRWPNYTFQDGWTCDCADHEGPNDGFCSADPIYGCPTMETCNWNSCYSCWSRYHVAEE